MHQTDADTPIGAEMLMLRHVARIVARDDDAESRIQDILRHLAYALGLIRGRVLLPDPAAAYLYIRYAHGLTPAELERGRYRIGEGVSGRVFQTGETALIANVHDEPGSLSRALPDNALPPEQVAFLAVPIVRDHRAVGVLAAHRLRNPERHVANDLALLEVIATLIGQLLCTEELPESRAAEKAQDLTDRQSARLPVPPGKRNTEADVAGRVLMLQKAEHWRDAGRLHQATGLYLKLAAQHPGTEQALAAKARLLEIARHYESRGASRLALDVLERLQQAIDGWDTGSTYAAPDSSVPSARPARSPAPDPWDSEEDSSSGGIPMRIR